MQFPVGRVAVRHHARGISVVTMRGEHDLSTLPVLTRALDRASARSNVVIDLMECSFIDSTLIQSLIRTKDMMAPSGQKVILIIPREPCAVADIAKMACLAQIFDLYASKDAAFACLDAATRDDRPHS
jgi:anti-anti-sigma factor